MYQNISRQFRTVLPFRSFYKSMSTSQAQYKEAGKLLNPKTTIAKITSKTPLENKDARFVNLKKLEYTSPLGTPGVWEIATRTTKPKDALCDAVVIIPVLKFANGDKKLVFVRQFRPPTNGIVVEFPAGLVDPNDSLESCAVRELKEETGYSGKIVQKSNVLWSDPGLSNATSVVVWADVDMELEENKNPVPHWMDNEVIEVITVKTTELQETFDKWVEQGYLLDAKIQTFAFGMKLL